MTGQDVLDEPSTSHFGSIACGRNGIIYHPNILLNDGCHNLHDDDDWACKCWNGFFREKLSQQMLKKFKMKKKIKFKNMYNVNKLRWVHSK